MNTGNCKRQHSLAPWVVVTLAIFCSTALAEHGGRDRTDRDDRRIESHSDSDRSSGDRDRLHDADRDTAHEKELHEKSDGEDKDLGKGRDSKSDSKNRERDNGSTREIDTSIAAAIDRRIASDLDFEGHERRSGEVIIIGRDDDFAAIQQAGYQLISTQRLESISESIVRIQVKNGESVEEALQILHTIAPDAEIASNHLFRVSQSATENDNVSVISAPHGVISNALSSPVIGVIDTGADNSKDMLKIAVVETLGLTENGYVARAHGTIVSQIACTEGARLAVADVFGVDKDNHLVAPAEAIARGIDWLLSKHITLINISIEGPDNVVLSHVIRRALEKGAVIVAAAGNSGPAAPPTYPAAYPGVIAVTAVDENNAVYPRANRGDYIAFAARGVRIPVAETGSQGVVSGTSFAAPVVAAEIARRMSESTADLSTVLEGMRHDAIDLGQPGRDNVFGWGLITSPPHLYQRVELHNTSR